MFDTALGPREVHQDMPHHLCGDTEELRAILPFDLIRADQTHVRFMHQRRSLEGVIGPLVL